MSLSLHRDLILSFLLLIFSTMQVNRHYLLNDVWVHSAHGWMYGSSLHRCALRVNMQMQEGDVHIHRCQCICSSIHLIYIYYIYALDRAWNKGPPTHFKCFCVRILNMDSINCLFTNVRFHWAAAHRIHLPFLRLIICHVTSSTYIQTKPSICIIVIRYFMHVPCDCNCMECSCLAFSAHCIRSTSPFYSAHNFKSISIHRSNSNKTCSHNKIVKFPILSDKGIVLTKGSTSSGSRYICRLYPI